MRYFLKSCVKIYRLFFSAWTAGSCRFYPSCSQYALDCLDRFPVWKAVIKIFKRVGSCHPFHPGGVNFVEHS